MKIAVQFAAVDKKTRKPKYIFTKFLEVNDLHLIGGVAQELRKKYLNTYIVVKIYN